MTHVVLQPCAAPVSRRHYADTVERPVDLSSVEWFLSEAERTALSAAHPSGAAALWGVMPGGRDQQVAKWNRMELGDHIFFAGGGTVFADAVVTAKLRNPILAQALWGTGQTANGLVQTWELMFALDDVTPTDLAIPNLNIAIGRQPSANVQEFVVLDEEVSEVALRLLPAAGRDRRASHPGAAGVEEVAIEARNIDRYIAQRTEDSAVALRREAELVRDYTKWLEARGQETVRHRIRLPEGGHLFTDVFNVATRELLEAKAGSSRDRVRMGLGQLLDYGRYVDHARQGLLLPERPVADLIGMLHDHRISVVWRDGSGFHRSEAE